MGGPVASEQPESHLNAVYAVAVFNWSPEAQDVVEQAEQRHAKRAEVRQTEDEEEAPKFVAEVGACVEKAKQRQKQRPAWEQELIADTIVVVIDSDYSMLLFQSHCWVTGNSLIASTAGDII